MTESASMFPSWYDGIAPLYDRAIRNLYLPYRRLAVEMLELQAGQTMVDLGCGSGLNLELVRERIGAEGTLIGVDFSAKMLGRAKERVNQHGWTNVHLLQRDARLLGRGDLAVPNGRGVDRILCTLGLSVFPDWETVLDRTFELLSPCGRYCIMDLYNGDANLHTRLINVLARSEISRKVWAPLQAKCADYDEQRHPLLHGMGEVVIATGTPRDP